RSRPAGPSPHRSLSPQSKATEAGASPAAARAGGTPASASFDATSTGIARRGAGEGPKSNERRERERSREREEDIMRRRRDASSATTTRSSPSRPLLLLAALAALPCLLCASAADGFSFAPKATTTAARARARTGGPSPLAPRPGERSTAVATTFRMTKEDDDRIRDVEEATEEGEVESSSEEDQEVAAAGATTEATADVSAGGGGRKDSGGTTGFSLILLPTLLLKFAVVLCVKFATDVVVFPLLWAYRLARLGKRKAVRGAKRLFGIKNGGGGGVGGKVNGDAGEAS
ncbi:hypothetical protein ACHAWF_010448, partial [Thalassiosira exigua]